MKKIVLFLLLLALVLSLLLLNGCGEEKSRETQESVTEPSTEPAEPDYEYQKVSVQDFEPYADSLFLSAGAYRTEIDGNTYEFERTIPEEQRTAFVDAQRALFALIAERTELSTAGYTFRILEDYKSRTLSEENRAYLHIGATASWEQGLITMQLLMGDYTNYGYLYALGDHFAGDLGWDTEDYSADSGIFADEPQLLTLVYPCFDRSYCTQKEIESAKGLSVDLLSRMEDPYAGEAAFLEQAQAYAQEKALDYTPTYLRFANHGTYCPLRVEGKYLEFLWDDEFEEDIDVTDGLLEEDWAKDVSTMIAALEETEAELDPVCEAFDFTPETLVPTILTDSFSVGGHGEVIACQGLFVPGEDTIYICGLSVVLHEYVHYIYDCLASDNSYESWRTEALAYYFGRFDRYEAWVELNGAQGQEYFKLLTGKDLTDADTFLELYDVEIYLDKENYNPKYWIDRPSCGDQVLSIAAYIIRNYGEENFVQIMVTPLKALVLTGRTMEEIEEDWSDYILYEKEYSEFVEQYLAQS